MNITWLILPIIFLYSILYSVIVSNYNFLIYSLMAYLFMEVSKYVTTLYTIDKIEKIKTKNKVYLVVMGIFASFISNFGPIYSLIKRNMKKYKTVR